MGDDFMDDIFASMFAGAGGSFNPGGGRGRQQPKRQTRPSVVEYPVTLEELFVGKEKNVEVERQRTCGSCKGCVFTGWKRDRANQTGHDRSGAKPRTKPRPCNKCQGSVRPPILSLATPLTTHTGRRLRPPPPRTHGSTSSSPLSGLRRFRLQDPTSRRDRPLLPHPRSH